MELPPNYDYGEFKARYPVHIAAMLGNVQLVKKEILQCIVQSILDVQSNLLNQGNEAKSVGFFDINIKDKIKGFSPLHLASRRGHFEVCQTLLRCGADLNLEYEDGSTCADLAHVKGHRELAEFLISQGGHLKTELWHFRNPIHSAAFEGSVGNLVREYFPHQIAN